MRKRVALLLLFLLPFSVIQAQSTTYQGDWEKLRSRPYPQWFSDAKLGIFIHWSLSAVPAWSGKEQYAEWFLRGLLTGDSARINFQKRTFGENWQYADYAPLFKGELFNADEWANLFANSGAKYIIFVSKHHDGYCLWPSKYAPGWNSMEVGPHHDIVGELATAVRAKGLKLGLYYSLPEWNNKLYRWGTDKPERVNKYVEDHMIPQFKELVSTYKPSLIFSDGEWDHPAATWHAAELISWYYNLMGDEAIVNDRWGSGSNYGYRTPEYSSGLQMSTTPWTEVRGLGRSFGLNRNEPLENYMTPKDLIHFFVQTVANGGGITLNVGPYCDGQIPLLQQERLLQLGSWLKVNGEAIYGSRMYKQAIEQKNVELKRVDSEINFDWVRNSPGKPIAEDNFTATWTGFICPDFTETYLFEARANDVMKVYVNNLLVIDYSQGANQGTQSNVMEAAKSTALNGKIALQAGKKYPIRIEYREDKLEAEAFLWWSSPSVAKQIIPAKNLFTDASLEKGNGLNAVYRSKAPAVCYTVNHNNLYAIALDWPKDNKLVLHTGKPQPNARVSLLGRAGNLPFTYANNQLIIDVSKVKITELPCDWAWTFKLENIK